VSLVVFCKKCGIELVGKEWGKIICSSCDKRPRCKNCEVILKKKNKGLTNKLCWVCEEGAVNYLRKCGRCGVVIKEQTYERWIEHGNYCNNCIRIINSSFRKKLKWIKGMCVNL